MARSVRPKRRAKKKTEFSKRLVAWAMVVTTACIAVSYGLSWTDHDSCQEITIAVVTACISIATAYEAKSYGEKNSRNKYGCSADGSRNDAKQASDENEPVG